MKLLAIDTATDACTVALQIGHELVERVAITPRDHARLLLPMIDEVLAEGGIGVAALDALAFGRGPGSFTGVRIATGVAQGIACAHGIALVPVSDLAALAQQAARRHGMRRVIACLDARMGEVYWGLYECGAGEVMALVGSERLSAPEAVAGADAFAAGPGWAAYPELGLRLSPPGVDAELLPQARDIITLALPAVARGATVDAAAALPTYLRNEVAWK